MSIVSYSMAAGDMITKHYTHNSDYLLFKNSDAEIIRNQKKNEHFMINMKDLVNEAVTISTTND